MTVSHLVAIRVIGRTRWVMLATVFVSVGDCDEVLRVWGSFVILKGFGFLALVSWGCLLGGVWMRLQLVMPPCLAPQGSRFA